MAVSEKQKAFYKFLKHKEKTNALFTKKDVLAATGWKKTTFNAYLSKGQISEFVSVAGTSNDKFEASNTLDISFKQFEKKLSQSKHVQSLGHNCKSKLAKALLRKSKDNMLLALELYNRPSLENKIDGFVMLFCVSWEQLLKAMLIEQNGEEFIYKKLSKKGIKETKSLRNCLDSFFPNVNTIKENITKIAELRDKVVHLLMPEIQGVASRLFQSGVFNYSSKFEEFCEIPFINTDNTGMISLVGDFKTPPLSMLKSIYGDAADEILLLATNLTQSIEETNDLSFAIPLNVTLQFAKKNAEGTQIVLTQAQDGITGLKKALVIKKTVDVEKTHPYKQGQIITAINKKLYAIYDVDFLNERLPCKKNNKAQLNKHCFGALVHKLNWKNTNNKYHHHLVTASTHLYSENAIDEIIKKIKTEDKNYVSSAKLSYNYTRRLKNK